MNTKSQIEKQLEKLYTDEKKQLVLIVIINQLIGLLFQMVFFYA